MTSNFLHWIQLQAPDFTINSAATELNVSFSTVRRHVRGEELKASSAETIVALCRLYKLNPVEGLVQAGVVSREEADRGANMPPNSLGDHSDIELLRELMARAEKR